MFGLWACWFWCFQISTSFGKKSLSAPLRPIHTACFENIWIIMFNNNVFMLSILIMLR